MSVRALAVVAVAAAVALPASVFAAEGRSEPDFMRGLGKVVGGVVLELPKTLIDATMTSPPIIGIPVGLLAGTGQAFRVTCEGLREMSAGFDPWGSKKRRRISQ